MFPYLGRGKVRRLPQTEQPTTPSDDALTADADFAGVVPPAMNFAQGRRR
jgi:hypothetical protein